MLGIKPAGDFDAQEIQVPGKKPKGVAWCKRCGRKHPRKAPCDLVESDQHTLINPQTLQKRKAEE